MYYTQHTTQQTTSMAPIQTKHSRAARSAKDARGIYAPLPDTAPSYPAATAAPLDTTASVSAQRHHRDNDAFAFSERGGFKVNKKDKRTVRHNALLAKVREGGVQKRQLKRRRPAKKLKTDVGDLADALPDVEMSQDEDEWEGVSEDGDAAVTGMRKAKRRRQTASAVRKVMEMKSLRHRPGAMKRKRRMEQGEMERFGRNLAQMVGGEDGSASRAGTQESGAVTGDGPGSAARSSQADRWAALRTFIGGTMEQDKAFAKK